MPIGDILAGAGMGLLLGPYNDERQMRQQERFQRMEIEGAKEMALFNQKQQMKMWEDTNYLAQRRQLEKAGMSVGLLYGKGGQGGSLQATPGSVSAGKAERPQEMGMGLQLGMQSAMMKAQIALTQAQAKNLEADTANKEGVQRENVAASTEVLKHEATLKRIASELQNETLWDQVEAIRNANDISVEQITKERAEAGVADATKDERIKQITMQSTEQSLRIAQQKGDLKLTNEQIKKVAEETANIKVQQTIEKTKLSQKDWDQAQESRRIAIQEMVAKFATSDLQQAKLLTDIVGNMLGSAKAGTESMIPRGGKK